MATAMARPQSASTWGARQATPSSARSDLIWLRDEGRGKRVATVKARRAPLEGVSEELNNLIVSQSMDWARGRRRVRDAFLPVQHKLDHLLFKLAPAGIRTEERYGTSLKGMEIFWKQWLPPLDSVRAAVFFCHGYGDTCTFFFEGIAKRISAAGYAVYAMDYPGFGLSEGLHGYIASFDDMVDCVIQQYALIRGMGAFRDLPHFLLGQSMGGAVALKIHLKQPKQWDGMVLVAPMCKISEDVTPPGIVLRALSLLSCIFPEAKFFPLQDIAELAFRDPDKKRIANFNVISYSDQMRLRTAMELIKATRYIESQLEKVSSPLLVLHGAADKVTDPQVSRFLHSKACSRDKTLKIYDDGYHSILEGEPDVRIESVIHDIISWFDSHSSPN